MTPNISSDLSATTSTVSSIEWKTIRISFPTRKALSRQLCLFDPALMTDDNKESKHPPRDPPFFDS
eukprot:scaffold164076_cov51-Cyclotella_meneghiniana.AAC.8